MTLNGVKTIDDLDFSGQRVLVRVDLNVPFRNGKISDDTRIWAVEPTVDALARRGAKVILLSHRGRPKGKVDPERSLRPVVPALQDVLARNVGFVEDCGGPKTAAAVSEMSDGDIILLENIRFDHREEANDDSFTSELAQFGDIYVNDAFSCAHRAHVSTTSLASRMPAVAGRNLISELEALDKVIGNPEHPVAAIIGGAKVSSKLEVIGHLLGTMDQVMVTGGMANTFLLALGRNIGRSLCEPGLVELSRKIMAEAKQSKCEFVLPQDVVVAPELTPDAPVMTVPVSEVPDDQMILDIGPQTIRDMQARIHECKTVLWNGPLGAFETAPFDVGTNSVAKTVAARSHAHRLISVAGGGDTVAALRHAGAADGFSHLSTGGGAFLEWLEGKTLPGIKALES